MTKLSPRESEILELVAKGLTDRGIAMKLGIGVQTARNYVKTIKEKLEANCRATMIYHGVIFGELKVPPTYEI